MRSTEQREIEDACTRPPANSTPPSTSYCSFPQSSHSSTTSSHVWDQAMRCSADGPESLPALPPPAFAAPSHHAARRERWVGATLTSSPITLRRPTPTTSGVQSCFKYTLLRYDITEYTVCAIEPVDRNRTDYIVTYPLTMGAPTTDTDRLRVCSESESESNSDSFLTNLPRCCYGSADSFGLLRYTRKSGAAACSPRR